MGPGGGAVRRAALIFGTLASSLLALLIAVPLSLGVAIYLTEFAPKSVRQPVAFLIGLLAAIPSVVYGLWGIFVLIPLLRTTVFPFLRDTLGFLPFFQGRRGKCDCWKAKPGASRRIASAGQSREHAGQPVPVMLVAVSPTN